MKIQVICKGLFDKAVPIINISQALNASGHSLSIVCGSISDGLNKELTGLGIEVTSLSVKDSFVSNRVLMLLSKLKSWIDFRFKASKEITKQKSDLLYIATADTAIALRGKLGSSSYILHLRELYDKEPHYIWLFAKSAKAAKHVIVPEINRAYIYYSTLNLNKVPLVIPNKPFYHPRRKRQDISFLDTEIQLSLKAKKIILYQGPIHVERNLEKLVIACRELPDYNLVLLGQDYGLIEEYFQLNPEIIYISYVSPPLHLNVTSWADIGIVSYDMKSLNTIYCAPNKVWEYSGYGVPVLCSENPGLQDIVKQFDAGVSVSFEDPCMIRSAIRSLESDYYKKSNNAVKFYDSIKIDDVLKAVIKI